jgi:hypothetical protein
MYLGSCVDLLPEKSMEAGWREDIMARRDYLNFDLLVVANNDGTYSSRVTASPAGEASGSFEFPFSPLELENYLLKLGPSRPTVRRIDSPDVSVARSFGSTLYQAVFSGEVGTTYRLSLNAAESEGKGLRLRLRLSDAPALSALPWEFLQDDGVGDFLVLSERRPLVRYPDLPKPVKPLHVAEPLQIVLVVSSPSDYDQLDTAREQELLEEALADPIADGRVELTVLEKPTLSALQRTLARQPVHILHYIGHGGFDGQTDQGVLLFEDDQGRGKRIGAGSLGTILHDHDPLRLVVLNACEGARSGTDDPFAGVAPKLAQRGAPAVLAMQFEITDQTAVTFGHEFYMALADGYPVDAATAAARKAIFARGNGLEWATPVLYLRAPDGKIFDLATPPEPKPKPDEGDVADPDEPGPPPTPWTKLLVLIGALGAVALLAWLIWNIINGGYEATYLDSPPTIDGDGAEWGSVTPHPTDHVAEGDDPDPRVSSEWRFAWNEEALYMFVEVTDPEIQTPNADRPGRLWAGDGINFIFGPDPSGLPDHAGLRSEDLVIMIGPNSPAATEAVVGRQTRVTGVPGPQNCEDTQFGNGEEVEEVDAAVRKTDSGYNVEAMVPWDVLLLNSAPEPGEVFGIIFAVVDGYEEVGDRRGSRSSHPDRENVRRCPGLWNETLVLAP